MDQRADGFNHAEAVTLAREAAFRLGAVEVRPAPRELVGPAGRARLEPRVMRVLVALARANGAILTRDDLIESCWDGRIVGDDALTRVISKLRRALEETGPGGWTLETLPKVGYRLVPGEAASEPTAPRPAAQPRSAPGRSRRGLLLAAGGAAAIAAVGGGAVWLTRPRIPPRARELYDRGRQALEPGLEPGNQQAVGFLREAVDIAPDYAAAWGALALAYQATLLYTPPPRQAGVTAQAEAAARRALELDPREPQATAALALLINVYRDWTRAEGLYQRALALHARDPQIEFIYARLLLGVGRHREAVNRAQAAVAGDEFAVWHRHTLALCLWAAGRTEEAEQVLDKALERWPRHYALWFTKHTILTYSGRADRALAMDDDTATWPLNTPAPNVELGRTAARALASNAPADIAAAAKAQLEAAQRGAGYAENALTYLAAVGRLDDAFALARQMYFGTGAPGGQRFSSGQFVVGNRRQTHHLFMPPTAAMRADPRFPPLMADLGLAAYWRTAPPRPRRPELGAEGLSARDAAQNPAKVAAIPVARFPFVPS